MTSVNGMLARCNLSRHGESHMCVVAESGWIDMDFPAEVAKELPRDEVDAMTPTLVDALGLPSEEAVVFVGRNRLDLVVEVSRGAFDVMKPDFARLCSYGKRAVCVTSPGNEDERWAVSLHVAARALVSFRWGRCYPCYVRSADFVSRLFAPAVGIDEDPVTGSAHCSLGPYWAAKLGKPAGATLEGCQVIRVEPDVRRALTLAIGADECSSWYRQGSTQRQPCSAPRPSGDNHDVVNPSSCMPGV